MTSLRKIMITVMTVAMVIMGKDNALYYPLMWLRHFLIGNGKNLRVPSRIMKQAHSAIVMAITYDDWGTMGQYDCYGDIIPGSLYGRYCVSSSTLYEGNGFGNRPTLFYLMGGFSFMLKKHKEYPLNAVKSAIIEGSDEYDWHSNDDGKYFYSPLGRGKWIVAITKLMSSLYGNDLFHISERDGNACISNKLWEEMYAVGAKSFISSFKTVIKFTKEDTENIRKALYGNCVIPDENGYYIDEPFDGYL